MKKYILAYTIARKTPTKTILRDHWEAFDSLRDANKSYRALIKDGAVWSASVCTVVPKSTTDYF